MNYQNEMQIKDRAIDSLNSAVGCLQSMKCAASIIDSATANSMMDASYLEHALGAHTHIKAASQLVWQLAIAQRRPQAFKLRDLLEKAGSALLGSASFGSLGINAVTSAIELLKSISVNLKKVAESKSMTNQEILMAMEGRQNG